MMLKDRIFTEKKKKGSFGPKTLDRGRGDERTASARVLPGKKTLFRV